MKNYINGAIREAIGKGRALMAKIPGARELGRHFTSVASIATREVEQLIEELDFLYNDPDYNDEQNIKEKFSKFKHLSGRLSEIENVVIAAMSRKSDDDEFVNELVYDICTEINYPLPHPVASCLSRKYYHIYPEYNLICIPLLESQFMLHIPDIYHELGHPLLSGSGTNPKVEAFQRNLGAFNVEVKKYFDEHIKYKQLNTSADSDLDQIYVWKESWLENWSIELFCDLFATFTLGPAYLWSNIHMCAKMSWEVYKLPTFQKTLHPPDDARMKAMFYGLDALGLTEQTKEIEVKWEEFKQITGHKKTPEYAIALPDKLLKLAAEYCYVGTKEIKCELTSAGSEKKVNQLLNNAWKQFWNDPENFHEFEKKVLTEFSQELRKS